MEKKEEGSIPHHRAAEPFLGFKNNLEGGKAKRVSRPPKRIRASFARADEFKLK